jgi:hypothetical protein
LLDRREREAFSYQSSARQENTEDFAQLLFVFAERQWLNASRFPIYFTSRT